MSDLIERLPHDRECALVDSSNILDNSGLWKSKDGSSRQQDLDSQSIGQKCGKDDVESVGSRNRKNSLSKIFGNTNSG